LNATAPANMKDVTVTVPSSHVARGRLNAVAP
jgi:hypothetical protein